MKNEAIKIANENEGVVGIKLKSGEMIVSTLLEKSTNATGLFQSWQLLHPCLLVQTSNMSYAIIPWLCTDNSSEGVAANFNDFVLAAFAVPEELRKKYLEMTGQKTIITPNRKVIL